MTAEDMALAVIAITWYEEQIAKYQRRASELRIATTSGERNWLDRAVSQYIEDRAENRARGYHD